jgi:2-octaprenyl-6-methoxyphenol hydroxylase
MRADATEILVRGAGPVGCVAALLLQRAGRRVALLASDAPASAFRPIVLSYASRLILERVGIWPSLAPTAIETIHVSQAERFGRTVFSAADAGVPALGYVLEYAVLLQACAQRRASCLPAKHPPRPA